MKQTPLHHIRSPVEERRIKEIDKIMETGTSTEYDKGFKDGYKKAKQEIGSKNANG